MRGDQERVDWRPFWQGCLGITCLYRACDHWHDGDVDRGQDVDDREDQVDLDGTVPLGMLPAEIGQAEDGKTDRNLREERGKCSTFNRCRFPGLE